MSGMFRPQVVTQGAPTVSSFRVSTSVLGRAIPVGWGTFRVAANLLWYGSFTPVPYVASTSSTGKGGITTQNLQYNYTVAVLLGLCEGPVADIPRLWIGSSVTTPAQQSMSKFLGNYAQNPFGYLSTYYASQALSYRGLAYLAASAFQLGSGGALGNVNAEVSGPLRYDAGAGIIDANLSDVVNDYLTNAHYGAGFPAAKMGDLTAFSNWCVASGTFVSPCYTNQEQAASALKRLLQIGNAGGYYSDDQLKIVPYADQAITGNGVTYTPDVTPVYALTDSDFQPNGGQQPVTVSRVDPADAFNEVQLVYQDRNNAYNKVTVEAKDQNAVELYGVRPANLSQADEICLPSTAALVAQTQLQRSIGILNTYGFRLSAKFSLLEPMDVVTLTETATTGLQAVPVRIVSVAEDAGGYLSFTAEDFPAGVSTAVQYPRQAAAGYLVDYNAPPGDANPPVFMEAPSTLAPNGLAIWIAVSGSGADWGGASVWVSQDGTSYLKVGTAYGSARVGMLAADLPQGADPDTADTLHVDLGSSLGTLVSGTQADADSLNTLCWVDGEWCSYATATLEGANRYALGYLRRGQYHIAASAHIAGSRFVRTDEVARQVDLPFTSDRVGKPIYVKLTSFNKLGIAEQSLADVMATQYIIQGIQLFQPLPNPASISAAYVAGATQLVVPAVDDFRNPDYEFRYGASFASGIMVGRSAA